ncbi:hypothetical protein F5B20DRAFT_531374 [Whalleya microplaca]|nr:hypothetical protein F5B20DRAFT_531374 [Whalleya microplaca]
MPESGDFDDLEMPGLEDRRSWCERLGTWKYEVLAAFISFASFVGLVIISTAFSDRLLSEWPLQVITINGVVAALTTLMKGALMVPIAESIGQTKWTWFSLARGESTGRPFGDMELIDSASRGLWGSLLWLVKYPLSFRLVTFGAMVTLLSAGLDVFSQQLVSIENRLAIDPAQKAHIPWAAHNNIQIDDRTWLAAFNQGIYNPDIDDIFGSCPSGNCTWDTVPSVGICGDCKDITYLLPKEWISCSGFFCNYSIPRASWWDITLENGPRPNSTWTYKALYEVFTSPSTGLYTIPVSTAYSSYDFFDPFVSNGLWSNLSIGTFNVIDVPYTQISHQPRFQNDSIWSFGDPSATKCAFWSCMQAFEVNMTAGIPKQSMRIGESLRYTTHWKDERGLERFTTFEDIDGFNMQGRNFSVAVSNGIDISVEVRQLFFGPGNGTTGFGLSNDPQFLKAWNYTTDDRVAWTNRLAKSLTNAIRLKNQPNPEGDLYAGVVWMEQAYIRVAWLWVIYPFSILVASLVLFTLTIWKNLRTNQNVWGNSTIASLMSDVDIVMKEKAKGSYASKHALMESVRNMEVKLVGGESGWTFENV